MNRLFKKTLTFGMALGLSATLAGISFAANPTDDVTVIYTNDVHTYIDNYDKDKKEPLLSYDNVAAMKKELQDNKKAVVLVDAGDHVQGTAFGGLDQGKQIIEIMNATGYDVATIGNHEFDYGMSRALEIFKEAKFPYVSCNFISLKDNKAVLNSYKIFELNGAKVAFVGISTPETFIKSTPKYFMDENGKFIYTFKEDNTGKGLYETAQVAIDAAKKDGADFVIALGHLGDDPSSAPWTSEDVIKNTTGLNAFIDGHSHSTVEGKMVADKAGNEVLLTQTGSYLKNIGQLNISKDGKIATKLIKEYKNSDATVKALVDKLKKDVESKLGKVIAYSEADMYITDPATKTRLIRKQETNLGDFCADAIYYLFDKTENLPVDLAIMNGGGIRANMPKGEVSYKTLKAVHTFGNVLCLIKVDGQTILDALEWGAKDVGKGENGGFLHTAGLTFTIDASVPANVTQDTAKLWTGSDKTKPYRVKDVKVLDKKTGEYKPLDLNATYNLAGTNYTLRDMGDGFNMFSKAELVKDYVMEDYLALANYAQSFEKNADHDNLPTITAEKYGDINGKGYMTIVNLSEQTQEVKKEDIKKEETPAPVQKAEEPKKDMNTDKQQVEVSTTDNDVAYYIVLPGDNLFKIAGKKYGNSLRWTEIYDLNKSIIKNPALIYAGQKLAMPSK